MSEKERENSYIMVVSGTVLLTFNNCYVGLQTVVDVLQFKTKCNFLFLFGMFQKNFFK